MDLSRQVKLIDGSIQEATFLVVGAGAVGSNVAYILSKMGAGEQSIHLYDHDRVEEVNVAPARFSTAQVGQLKALAVKTGVWNELNVATVVPHTEKYRPGLAGKYSIVISCPDNMATRRAVWENRLLEWKWLIDPRMGGDQGEIYCVGPGRESVSPTYLKAIEFEDTPLPCGEKATAPISAGFIPGIVGMMVANIVNGHSPPKEVFYSMNGRFLSIEL